MALISSSPAWHQQQHALTEPAYVGGGGPLSPAYMSMGSDLSPFPGSEQSLLSDDLAAPPGLEPPAHLSQPALKGVGSLLAATAAWTPERCPPPQWRASTYAKERKWSLEVSSEGSTELQDSSTEDAETTSTQHWSSPLLRKTLSEAKTSTSRPLSPAFKLSLAPWHSSPRQLFFGTPAPKQKQQQHMVWPMLPPACGKGMEHFWPSLDASLVAAHPTEERQFEGQRDKHDRCRRCQLMIATHLKELEQEDANCIIYVRQINKLGFRSAEILKEHYERYGPVAKVLMSNSHDKAPNMPVSVRLRPSGIGFVLMERPEDAAAAIAAGELQIVRGVQIKVRRFELRVKLLKGEGSAEAEETPEAY